MSAEAVIVSTARTPLAKSFRGAFNMSHGAHLGGVAPAHGAGELADLLHEPQEGPGEAALAVPRAVDGVDRPLERGERRPAAAHLRRLTVEIVMSSFCGVPTWNASRAPR